MLFFKEKELCMTLIKKLTGYFSKAEIALWCVSVILIFASFVTLAKEKGIDITAALW